MIIHIFCLLLTVFSVVLFASSTRNDPLKTIDEFIQDTPSLPRYVEAGYSPLGRSPIVDSLLESPFSMPHYAKTVAEAIKERSQQNSLAALGHAVLLAGGIPLTPLNEEPLFHDRVVPDKFLHSFPQDQAIEIYGWWQSFLQIRNQVKDLLSVLTEEEKAYLRENYNRFFFNGQEDDAAYSFFTTDSEYPLKFFALASRLDLAKLADCALQLSAIVDDIYQSQILRDIQIAENFVWEENGVKFIISYKNHTQHRENADFFIDLGSYNTFYTNAGGTEGGLRPLALHLDTKGNNTYMGKNFVQGSGFLGVGILASFAGNNTYIADQYSQGCGFFGVGILTNLEGRNHFELNFGGQSFALFGSSLLWSKQGNNHYHAKHGMAQAASSTLGIAFHVDNQGNNTYISGVQGHGGKRDGGIGQGGSSGVRASPWLNNPSFYGGLSFLYVGEGNNQFKTAWLGQGSAYFLGAGILVAEGSNDVLEADYDSQGQGLHLAAGLLMKNKGDNRFSGGWGSLGVAGDRSVGMLIANGGNNSFTGKDQSVGTARKPKALGVFINVGDHNHYAFEKTSNCNVQFPQNPKEWPRALFLQIGEGNTYPQNVDGFKRSDQSEWRVEGHSLAMSLPNLEKEQLENLFAKFSRSPNIACYHTAYCPLDSIDSDADRQRLANEILTANYERRRQIYETLDFIRFSDRKKDVDLSYLFKHVGSLADDQFNYAAMWALRNKDKTDLTEVKNGVRQERFASDYARKMAVSLIGTFWTEDAAPLLEHVMLHDKTEEIRYFAALALTLNLKPPAIAVLKKGLASDSEHVRYAIAKGLQNNSNPFALEVIVPLFDDPSIYVRRAAAFTAIAHKDKRGISVLLETLHYDTLDTEDNYGDNIFKHLSSYVGVDFGLDKTAWIEWWARVKDEFEFV